jgi:16S rRNA (guanine(966)-N(2))-methyltransferase RsmD
MERTQIRIVAGSHRGRKLTIDVHAGLRPTPQMVREALFSILGHAVPGRPFYDVFAGTGVNGLEALSRGASKAVFVERDNRLAKAIDQRLDEFRLSSRGQVLRADVYRWADRWMVPSDGVNVFLSPPFGDFNDRIDEFLALVGVLAGKLRQYSVLVVQLEEGFPLEKLPDPGRWDIRHYGRNTLAFWEPEDRGPSDRQDINTDTQPLGLG